MKTKKVIYISGQITGLTPKEYTKNFEDVQWDMYWNKVGKTVNPLDLKPFLGFKTYWCYMVTDLIALSKCTDIAMQPNWIHSRGACIEYIFAKFIFKLEIIWL